MLLHATSHADLADGQSHLESPRFPDNDEAGAKAAAKLAAKLLGARVLRVDDIHDAKGKGGDAADIEGKRCSTALLLEPG